MTLDQIRERPTITVEQLAEVLNVSRASAYRAVREGQFPAIRVGRSLRIPTPALLRKLGE